jgi:hypothetical protein
MPGLTQEMTKTGWTELKEEQQEAMRYFFGGDKVDENIKTIY